MNQTNKNSEANYLCIRKLLDRGEKHLHRIFRQRWSIYHNMDYSIDEWKNDVSSGSQLVLLCPSISKAQKEILNGGDIDSWDISLTFSAIQGVSKGIRNYNGILNEDENKLILDLKNERNKHAHGKLEICDKEFSEVWERLSKIMVGFGDNLKEIEEIRNAKSKKNKIKTEYDKLKRKANKLLKQEKYDQAIDIYDQILQMSDICPENKSIIFSKQKAAYSLLESENPLKPVNKNIHDVTEITHPLSEDTFIFLKLRKSELMPNQIRQVFSDQPIISLKESIFEKTDPKTYEKMIAYYTKAANDGVPEGMFSLALHYENDKGGEHSEQEALQWLFKAATSNHGKGISDAQYLLGLKYYAGCNGVNRDPQKAVKWFEKAVENGCEAAANNLGVLYKFGEGVEQSSKKAFHYFKIAAENGDITGMQNLAHCYFTTQGTDINNLTEEHMKEGLKWMKMAENNEKSAAIKQTERHVNNSKNVETSEAKNLLNKKLYLNDITDAAKCGSRTAQKVIKIWKYMDDAMNAFEKNDSKSLVAALSKAIRLDYEIVGIPECFKKIIEERIKTHENDLDTIVCFVQINIDSDDFPIYVVRYLNRYRFDEYLFEMLIFCFMKLGELEAGLSFAENGVKAWPQSLRFLYCYAIALCKQDNPSSKAISALNAFLDAASPDHEKVPSCFYHKSEYYMSRRDNTNFIESYEAAQKAEKLQLPCFSHKKG